MITRVIEYDDLLSKVGSFGRFQWLVIACIGTFYTTDCFIVLGFIFIAATPDHWCRTEPEPEQEPEPEPEVSNATLSDRIAAAFLPPTELMREPAYSQCSLETVINNSMPSPFTNSTGLGCPYGRVYDTSMYTSTIVTEWDLVCDQRALVATSQSAFMAGLLIGVLGAGFLSDRFGRRRVAVGCYLFYLFSPLITTFSDSFLMYTAFRFFSGLAVLATSTSFLMLGMEVLDRHKRLFLSNAVCLCWAMGYFLLAGWAYLLRDWRRLQFCLGLMPLFNVPAVIFIPESPRWLYTKGRKREADDVMRWIAEWNRTEMPENAEVKFRQDTSDVFIWKVVYYPRLRTWTLVIFFQWFVSSMVYYGLSLSSAEMLNNDYLGVVISGAIEIPTYVLCQLTVDYFGRRKMGCALMVTAAVALLCTITVPADMARGWPMLLLSSIGKCAVTANFIVLFVHTTEVFPTVVRNSGFGTANCCARLGAVVAPFVGLLSGLNSSIHLATFGVLSLAAGVVVWALPETAHVRLPETLEDSEWFGRKDRERNGAGGKFHSNRDESQTMITMVRVVDPVLSQFR